MSHKFKARDKTIAEQIASMKNKYPKFTTEFNSHVSMKVSGILQPTSRSVPYEFI